MHARSSSSVAQAFQKILFHALQKNDNAFQVFSPATIPKIWNYIKEKKETSKTWHCISDSCVCHKCTSKNGGDEVFVTLEKVVLCNGSSESLNGILLARDYFVVAQT